MGTPFPYDTANYFDAYLKSAKSVKHLIQLKAKGVKDKLYYNYSIFYSF